MSLVRTSETLESLVDKVCVRTVLQRCTQAEVVIEGQSRGCMGNGLLLLTGFGKKSPELPAESVEAFLSLSTEARRARLEPLFTRWWDKLSQLRIFSDEQGKMNLSFLQQPKESGLYIVSQFTLFADLRKGNRPGFSLALEPAVARACFEDLLSFVEKRMDDRNLFSGVFAADMKVSLTNDGPVTVMFDCSLERGVEAL